MATNKKIHLFDDTLPHQSTYVMTTQKLKDKIQLNYNRSCDMLKSQKKYHAENMLSESLLNRVSLFFFNFFLKKRDKNHLETQRKENPQNHHMQNTVEIVPIKNFYFQIW